MAVDRYSKLLGLPSEPRPLDSYQLLGLDELCDDAEAVRAAGRAHLGRLTAQVGGPDHDDALALMAEVAEAVKVLTDPALKAAHDEPMVAERWRRFTAAEHEVMSRGHVLTEAGRRKWIEMGIGLNLPWQDVYRHIDAVSSRHAESADGAGPAVRLPRVSLEEADRIFRCLALGVEIGSTKSPEVYERLAEAGHRLGLPDGAQSRIAFRASDLGPAGWRLPLPEGAVAVDRERAFSFVARGAMFGRLLTAEDDMRLQEVALRAGLSAEAARRITDREIHRSRSVRKRDLEREAAAMAAIGSGLDVDRLTTEDWSRVEGRLTARRVVVMGGILVIVAGAILLLFHGRLFPRGVVPLPAEDAESVSQADREREVILQRVSDPEAARWVSAALGGGATADRRIEAIGLLAGGRQQDWFVDAMGWVLRNDLATEVRLAALEALADLDYATTRTVLVRAIDPRAPREVLNRVGDLLCRRRDSAAARLLLRHLTSEDSLMAAEAVAVLRKMTGLELTSGPPRNREDYWAYAVLVRRWVDAGAPAPGRVWEPLPTAASIMALSGSGPNSPREQLVLRLVDLGEKGQAGTWDRLVEVIDVEPSVEIRCRLAERLVRSDCGESVLLQVLLLGGLDVERTASVVANLAGQPGAPAASASAGRSVIGDVLAAERFRRWFTAAYPGLARGHAEAVGPRSPAEQFGVAAQMLVGLSAERRAEEAESVVSAARGGDFVAASLLVMLIRGDLSGATRKGALTALADLGTRESWFFLVDELARTESLATDVESALRGGSYAKHVGAFPEYGPTAVERFLAWQFAMRKGLAHRDRLPSRPFLRSRDLAEAKLPVVIPKEPPGTVASAAQKALDLYNRLGPADASAVRQRLAGYVAAGDAVASALRDRLP